MILFFFPFATFECAASFILSPYSFLIVNTSKSDTYSFGIKWESSCLPCTVRSLRIYARFMQRHKHYRMQQYAASGAYSCFSSFRYLQPSAARHSNGCVAKQKTYKLKWNTPVSYSGSHAPSWAIEISSPLSHAFFLRRQALEYVLPSVPQMGLGKSSFGQKIRHAPKQIIRICLIRVRNY